GLSKLGEKRVARKPSARELAREQAVLISGDYNAVMRCLEDYNPTAQRIPTDDEARQPHRKLAVRRAPQFVWVNRALLPGGGDGRLERMADAPGPHGLRRSRLPGPTRRKRKRESETEWRDRLVAVVRQVWKDSRLPQIDDWRQLERVHPPGHRIVRGVTRSRRLLEVIVGPSDELIRQWIKEVTSSSDEKSSIAQRIAYRLLRHSRQLPPPWVKSTN